MLVESKSANEPMRRLRVAHPECPAICADNVDNRDDLVVRRECDVNTAPAIERIGITVSIRVVDFENARKVARRLRGGGDA